MPDRQVELNTFWIIDAHNHYTAPSKRESADSSDIDKGEIDDRLRCLDARGVDQAIIIAGHGYLRPAGIRDTREINDGIARYRDSAPAKFPCGIGVLEPLYGEVSLPELKRCKSELNLSGVSFHTRFQGVSLENPWTLQYLNRMGELDLVPFIHSVGESPEESLWKIDGLAKELPDLTMVVLDAFSTFEQSAFVRHVADRRPNLVFDTALAADGFDTAATIAKEFGCGRILYGSDLYSWSCHRHLPDVLPQILASDLSDSDKVAIVGGNVSRLLGIGMCGS
jgi:predicted TIM-barrel fold metal-dependent hydrolase